ncbi:MAG: hypothetical protein MRZ79_26095 [Bacteroidia bacterium]|nr:hypothetical protein [Bacteroidia bacterium]
MNKGLSKIIAALNNKREVVEPVGLNKPETIIEQLAKIEASKKNINLEIQFTSEFTELPVYIISQYAFKGHVLVGSSAVDNPWIICVDDYEQPEDLYDTYYNNFNKLWDNSQKELKISTEITKNSKVLIEKANGLNLEDFPNNDALKIHLKNLVGKNEIKETFDYLFKYYYLRGNERQNYNNLVILSSRFETVVTEYRVGILDFESYKTEIANLQAGVLLMIDAIK